jgi:hypothetical protein
MSMTDEQRIEDLTHFKEAVDLYNAAAKSPLQATLKNHEFARRQAAVSFKFAPTAIFSKAVYSAVFAEHQAVMDHEAPIVIKQPERDRSGDYYVNKSHNGKNSTGITASDLDSIVARKNAEKELFQLRQEERISILSPEKKTRIDELMGTLNSRGLTPVQKSELVPLDINTSTQDLKKASGAQIKELLARRKKEGWVHP